MERWVWLLPAFLAVAVAQTCVKECLKTDSYYKKTCPDGLDLGAECSGEDGDEFCSTPYSRCMDGVCACLPEFEAKNMTYGQPTICVPKTINKAGPKRDPSADICRYHEPTAEDFLGQTLVAQRESDEYNEQVLGQSPSDSQGRRVRRKRQAEFVLPPTVVSACQTGQLCYQLGPSAYGVCRKPQCPVGKPGSTKNPCTVGDDASCPNGYHCTATGGQAFDRPTGTSSEGTICCPTICDEGFYRNGRCWRDATCLAVQDGCEDRCNFVACRFMVDPCENQGLCLVPKTLPGTAPDYFWCKCDPRTNKMGRVCEQDGEDLNRPSKSKKIYCEGSLCELPPVAAPIQPATPLVAKAAQLGGGVPGFAALTSSGADSMASGFAGLPGFAGLSSGAFNFPSVQTGASTGSTSGASNVAAMTCRADTDVMCLYWASIGDCTNDRKKMLAKCDCACTRLMNKNKNVRYYPIPAYSKGFNN